VQQAAPALLLLALLALAASPPAQGADATPWLTSPAEVRLLSPEEAGRGLPVRLRGVLLLVTAPGNALVVFDGQEGVYVELTRPMDGVSRLGDEVEVVGVSDAGDFAPIVRASEVTRLGPGTLPPPRPVTIAELNAGGYDAAWIELKGIVRSCVPTPPDRMPVSRAGAPNASDLARLGPRPERWLVILAQGDQKMTVQVNGRVSPEALVDAEVSLKAVVFNVHNANRQFVRSNLQVADETMVEIRVPPPADPFALPVQSIGDLLRFTRAGFTGHRVRVRGVVTGHQPGRALWVREGERGLRIDSKQTEKLEPGDEVDIVGFPDHGSYTPSLSDAIFRQTGSGPAPEAQLLRSAEDISRYDSNLVQLYADLRELRITADGVMLVLDWRGLEVHARLLPPINPVEVDAWQPGSAVRVEGICLVGQTDFLRPTGRWVAEDLQLLLRTPDDVAIMRPAPWLTTQRALRLVILVLVLTFAALIVVAILARRQIAQREEARKLAEVEFAAMLAERNRLAREIHDTLAQDLNAVSMQLELARNSARSGLLDSVLPYLSTAHQIVRNCLAEARESIWNMRSHILERTDLAGALLSVAQQLGAGLGCEIRSQVRGRPRRLPPTIENNLLRIGQEAVSNAIKHARPKVIDLELAFGEPTVRLTVRDDGSGFDPEVADASFSHFGLRGMRERVQQMNGTFHIEREADGGTRIEVVVDAPALV
jgi:signal transduction histidine kinase